MSEVHLKRSLVMLVELRGGRGNLRTEIHWYLRWLFVVVSEGGPVGLGAWLVIAGGRPAVKEVAFAPSNAVGGFP